MIANPEKFHAMPLRKNQTSTNGENINIDGEIIKSEETVKLLGVTLDQVYIDLILILVFPTYARKLQHS